MHTSVEVCLFGVIDIRIVYFLIFNISLSLSLNIQKTQKRSAIRVRPRDSSKLRIFF